MTRAARLALPDRSAPGSLRRVAGPALATLLTAAMLAALYGLPLLRLAPNRLVVGAPIYADQILGALAAPLAGLVIAGGLLPALARGRTARFAALVMLGVALLLLAVALGTSATHLTTGRPGATWARLASGAFLGAGTIATALLIVARPLRRQRIALLIALLPVAAIPILAASGHFDHVSLAVEYGARRAAIGSAVLTHLWLSAAALLLAASTTLALYAVRPARSVVELLLGGVQVVPAVALLGGLVVLAASVLNGVPALRELGFAALGPLPAVLGIAAYLMLPLWRGLRGALRAPDPATVEAGRALGLSPAQTLVRIQLPLGAAILVGALRVATVQGVGLATLGALVGAGGLGTIVFDGMAQFAPDLILLGAIPVVALSLGADNALGWVERSARRRWNPSGRGQASPRATMAS